MNAPAFYILGALVVLAALAAVGLPRVREATAGLLAFTTAMGVLAMASGAYATGVVEILLSALAILGAGLALRRAASLEMARATAPTVRSLVLAACVAAGLLVIVLIAFAGNSSDWHAGSGHAALLTLLPYRAPFALVGGLLALLVGVTGALLVGRRGADEVEYDRGHEARRLREDKAQRRRADREAARRRRRAPADGAG